MQNNVAQARGPHDRRVQEKSGWEAIIRPRPSPETNNDAKNRTDLPISAFAMELEHYDSDGPAGVTKALQTAAVNTLKHEESGGSWAEVCGAADPRFCFTEFRYDGQFLSLVRDGGINEKWVWKENSLWENLVWIDKRRWKIMGTQSVHGDSLLKCCQTWECQGNYTEWLRKFIITVEEGYTINWPWHAAVLLACGEKVLYPPKNLTVEALFFLWCHYKQVTVHVFEEGDADCPLRHSRLKPFCNYSNGKTGGETNKGVGLWMTPTHVATLVDWECDKLVTEVACPWTCSSTIESCYVSVYCEGDPQPTAHMPMTRNKSQPKSCVVAKEWQPVAAVFAEMRNCLSPNSLDTSPLPNATARMIGKDDAGISAMLGVCPFESAPHTSVAVCTECQWYYKFVCITGNVLRVWEQKDQVFLYVDYYPRQRCLDTASDQQIFEVQIGGERLCRLACSIGGCTNDKPLLLSVADKFHCWRSDVIKHYDCGVYNLSDFNQKLKKYSSLSRHFARRQLKAG